jgi:hypothetical protein
MRLLQQKTWLNPFTTAVRRLATNVSCLPNFDNIMLTLNLAQMLPQILLYVLPGRDSFMYERLKKNMECRFAMVSQMLNVAHVKKAQPQYCSNVCMKLNAKLGGTSCKVADTKPPKPFFARPTMIIGKSFNPNSQIPTNHS